jgi:hypothetical protein
LPLAITEARAAQNQPTASNSQPAAAPKVASVWLTELIRLARSAVDEPVLFSFVDSAGTFNLGAEQIIYLRDLGISNDLITTIILHDSEIVSGQREVTVSPIALSRPALAVKLAPPAPPARTRAPEDYDSIIAPDDFTSEEFLPDDLFPNFTAERSAPVRSAADDLYPVRKPYAVPVTEPLVLVNRAARTPNLVTVEMFH